MRTLPIPYPLIEHMDDRTLVSCLLRRLEKETDQFWYGMYHLLFKKLFFIYHPDCNDEVELTDDIYAHVMVPRPPKDTSRLQDYQFQCRLPWWMKVVSVHYCISKYKKRRLVYCFGTYEDLHGDEKPESMAVDISREDFEKIVGMMKNERYRDLIRHHYLENLDHDETAAKMGESMSSYYRTHERAKKQLKETYMKEMGH